MLLNHLENFKDIKGAALKIDKNTQCYYIKKDGKSYVAWQQIEKIENLDEEGKSFKYTNKYYSVLDGNYVCTNEVIYKDKKYENLDKSTKILPLYKVYNLSGNKLYTLNENDIIRLINFKEQNKKQSGKVF